MKKTLLLILTCYWTSILSGQNSATVNVFATDPLTALSISAYSNQDGAADPFFASAYATPTIFYSTISSTEIVGDHVRIFESNENDHRSLKFVTSNGYSTYITYVHTQRLLY